MWGSVDMFGYVAHVITATSACPLLHALTKEFQRQHLVAVTKKFTDASCQKHYSHLEDTDHDS